MGVLYEGAVFESATADFAAARHSGATSVASPEVVAMNSKQPLAGRRIAITRPREQAADLSARLEALGATVLALPSIAIEPVADTSALDAALAQLASYDWLVFTSANGVRAFDERLRATGLDWSARRRARVAAIGPATATALKRLGVVADLVPAEYVAEGLLEALGNVAGQRILLPRADIARDTMRDELRLRGAEVDEIAAYRTVLQPLPAELVQRALREERVDAITFTSSSTVRGLVESLRASGQDPAVALSDVALACIGPITAATLREYGLEPALVAQEYTVAGLVAALVAYFAPLAR
jgi:uroporphyrinogen III methyltransferase/synthase